MSLITKLLDAMFPKHEFRVLMLSLDAAGKTTVLYKVRIARSIYYVTNFFQLKLGEIVTTIPTIGFNVETLDFQGTSLTVWDVGGCDKIRPLWRHYFQNTDAIIYMVDSNDRDRMNNEDMGTWGSARHALHHTLKDDELRNAIVLVFANKQDLPGARSVNEVSKEMGLEELHDRRVFCQGCCATQGHGLTEGLAWLVNELKAKRSGSSTQLPPPPPPSSSNATNEVAVAKSPAEVEADRLEAQFLEWLTRTDEGDDEFLEKLSNYTLDNWDHHTHLRVAFLYLTRLGRRDGMAAIFEKLRAFIANSTRTKRSQGTTFHETMTYFWVHMVHYSIVCGASQMLMLQRQRDKLLGLDNMHNSTLDKLAISSASGSESKNGVVAENNSDNFNLLNDEQAETIPSVEEKLAALSISADSLTDFKIFLLMNPVLCNGGLFLHYYTKERMLTNADARVMVLLPDKKPLPSIIASESSSSTSSSSIATTSKQVSAVIQPKAPLTDVEFLMQLKSQQLPGWNHDCKIRSIYLLLLEHGRSSKSIDIILDTLKTVEKTYAHLTVNYFWIQMVTFHMAKAAKEKQIVLPSLVAVSNDQCISSNSFAVFIQLPASQCLRNSLLIDKYYSQALIDNGRSDTELALPNLKSFPSMV